ncbi:MAG: hypothetical protein AB7U51_11170 [Arcobacter sp.]|uniref:hypothetical protein n=1 Tax=Arcobacter sp. TaxID=1872629 RepID=UPI003D06303F
MIHKITKKILENSIEASIDLLYIEENNNNPNARGIKNIISILKNAITVSDKISSDLEEK